MLTAWIPISDVPLSMGGMMIVPSSHNCDAETTRTEQSNKLVGEGMVKDCKVIESVWFRVYTLLRPRQDTRDIWPDCSGK